MRVKLFAMPMLAALALSGCSDPAAYHPGEAEKRAMAPLPAPVKRFADAEFCRGVAHQQVPASFDAPSRDNLYAIGFRQCMMVFGPPNLRLADLGSSETSY
jgi:hypothetical protein